MGLVKRDRQSEGDSAEAAKAPVRYCGTVKRFNPLTGYGFIIPDGGGRDVFLQIRAVQKSGIRVYPLKGERYEYELGPGNKPDGNIEAKKLVKLQPRR